MNTTTQQITVDLEKFLIRASALIKALGYLSNAQAKIDGKQSTAELALAWADDKKSKEIMAISFDSQDKLTAKEVSEWMAAIPLTHGRVSDYMVKLQEIGKSKSVTLYTAGYAASAIAAFEKEKNKNSQEANTEQELQKIFGAPGTKIQEIQVIFIGKSQFDSSFGVCHKYQFVDSAGRPLAWITGTEFTDLV